MNKIRARSAINEKRKRRNTKKAEERRNRDAVAATAVSLAHTQDIGTPQDAGTRSSVQKTCMDGLMPTGADGQSAVGQGVFTNPGSGELHTKRRKKTAPRNGVLDCLEKASHQRVLPRLTSEPASGSSADTLARLFEQSDTFSLRPQRFRNFVAYGRKSSGEEDAGDPHRQGG